MIYKTFVNGGVLGECLPALCEMRYIPDPTDVEYERAECLSVVVELVLDKLTLKRDLLEQMDSSDVSEIEDRAAEDEFFVGALRAEHRETLS